jgi:signal transduction histidine kinase
LERDSLPIFSEGRHTGILWIYHDATARRRAADELRAEKDLLASTLSSIEDGVITVDASRQVQLINPAAEAMTGRPIADAVGCPINELLHLVDLNKCSDGNQLSGFLEHRLSTAGGDSERKLFILQSNGTQDRIVAISAHRVPGASSADPSGLLVFRDVSKDFETDRLKQDFIDSVSHELRSPLTSIRGFIDTILADHQMPDETRLDFLKIIRLQSRRLSQLVDNILDMSSVDAGATLYEDGPLQLRSVVECSCAEIAPQADIRGVHLVASIQPGLPDFTGDAMRLQSAITNLLGNAVKFTPEGGQVRLELGLNKGGFHISIRDTGLGISEEHLGRIFEKFYRVPRPGRQIPGTGLGLPIADAIVSHYGGRIEVESQIDQGSCFHIFLPLERFK